MGARYTAPFDRAAGPDGGNRGLTIAQADDALFERLYAIMRLVRRARHALTVAHGADSPIHARLNRIEDELSELIEDADYVDLIYPGARGGA